MAALPQMVVERVETGVDGRESEAGLMRDGIGRMRNPAGSKSMLYLVYNETITLIKMLLNAAQIASVAEKNG
jgi:hypothetical protein